MLLQCDMICSWLNQQVLNWKSAEEPCIRRVDCSYRGILCGVYAPTPAFSRITCILNLCLYGRWAQKNELKNTQNSMLSSVVNKMIYKSVSLPFINFLSLLLGFTCTPGTLLKMPTIENKNSIWGISSPSVILTHGLYLLSIIKLNSCFTKHYVKL